MKGSTKISTFLLGGLILMGGCGAQEQITNVQEIAETAQEKVEQVQGLLAHKDSLMGMKDDVSNTITAVKAGDFATAKENFTTIKTSWDGIQSSLGDASNDSVKSIQESIEGISTDLEAASPDQEKIVGGLESLSTSLMGVVNGGDMEKTPEAMDSTEQGKMEEQEETSATTETTTEDKAQAFTDNLMAMKTSLEKSGEALGSGDFAAAKESFGEARQTWFKFGGSVKAKSEETYQTLDAGVKSLNTLLGQESLDQETVKTGLDTLLTGLGSLGE